ncbi:MAG: hypothetical protein ACXWQQ_09830 [Pseudobdellovibrio sp.]
MMDLFISMFGIVIVHRISSLIEKWEVVSVRKRKFTFLFLQLPLLLPLFFKELESLVLIYIGIILIILILSDQIFEYFCKFSLEKMSLSLIQRLLLHLSTGLSAQSVLQNVWNELSAFEKHVFAPLQHVLDEKKVSFDKKNRFERFFFDELAQIFISNSQIVDQLKSFRRILQLQHNLRHRSRQSLYQARAQAVVCALIYVFILTISVQFLQNEVFSALSAVSFAMMALGLYFTFKMGSVMRWKT